MFPFGSPEHTPTDAPVVATDDFQDGLLGDFDLGMLDEGPGGRRDTNCIWSDFPRSGSPFEQTSGGVARDESCAWPPAGEIGFPASGGGVWKPCGDFQGEHPPGGSHACADVPRGGGIQGPVDSEVAIDTEELERIQDLAGRTPIPRWIPVSARGKPRTYEWPPQTDPEMERKRQRALRAFGSRQKASKREFQLQRQMTDLARFILKLQSQKESLKHRIALREAELLRIHNRKLII